MQDREAIDEGFSFLPRRLGMKVKRYREQVGQLLDARVRISARVDPGDPLLLLDVSLEEVLCQRLACGEPLEVSPGVYLDLRCDFSDWRDYGDDS
jgi:hypothetical protein